MDYIIIGANKDTGEDVTITIDATTLSAAESAAKKMNLFIERIDLVEKAIVKQVQPISQPTETSQRPVVVPPLPDNHAATRGNSRNPLVKYLAATSVIIVICIYTITVQAYKTPMAHNDGTDSTAGIINKNNPVIDPDTLLYYAMSVAKSFTGHTRNVWNMAIDLTSAKYRFLENNYLLELTDESLEKIVKGKTAINYDKYDGFEVNWGLSLRGDEMCFMSIDREGKLWDSQFINISEDVWSDIAGRYVEHVNPFTTAIDFAIEIIHAERAGMNIDDSVAKIERGDKYKITRSASRFDGDDGDWYYSMTIKGDAKDYKYEVFLSEGKSDGNYTPWSRLVVTFWPRKAIR